MSKRLRISGPFFEKTGNPLRDNTSRKTNKLIQRKTPQVIRVIAKGRKNRRRIFHVEGDRYQHIIAYAMNNR